MSLQKDKAAKINVVGTTGDSFSIIIQDFSESELVNTSMTEVGTTGVFYADWTPDTAGYFILDINSTSGFTDRKVIHVEDSDVTPVVSSELKSAKIQIINSLIDP